MIISSASQGNANANQEQFPRDALEKPDDQFLLVEYSKNSSLGAVGGQREREGERENSFTGKIRLSELGNCLFFFTK